MVSISSTVITPPFSRSKGRSCKVIIVYVTRRLVDDNRAIKVDYDDGKASDDDSVSSEKKKREKEEKIDEEEFSGDEEDYEEVASISHSKA